jgi:hypothetical protein
MDDSNNEVMGLSERKSYPKVSCTTNILIVRLHFSLFFPRLLLETPFCCICVNVVFVRSISLFGTFFLFWGNLVPICWCDFLFNVSSHQVHHSMCTELTMMLTTEKKSIIPDEDKTSQWHWNECPCAYNRVEIFFVSFIGYAFLRVVPLHWYLYNMCFIVYGNLLVSDCIDLQEIKELGSGTYN